MRQKRNAASTIIRVILNYIYFIAFNQRCAPFLSDDGLILIGIFNKSRKSCTFSDQRMIQKAEVLPSSIEFNNR